VILCDFTMQCMHGTHIILWCISVFLQNKKHQQRNVEKMFVEFFILSFCCTKFNNAYILSKCITRNTKYQYTVLLYNFDFFYVVCKISCREKKERIEIFWCFFHHEVEKYMCTVDVTCYIAI